MAKVKDSEDIIPALRFRALTGIYDAAIGFTTRERTFKGRLMRQAQIRPGAEVLDLGCGTGTLAIWAKREVPQASVHGLDADEQILAIARRKAERAGTRILFLQGRSLQLPYAAAAFDRVLSTLFFHHLKRDQKLQTLRELRRVLKPGGQLHVADWGKAGGPLMRALFLMIQLLDGFENTSDNVAGKLPAMMRDCGFEDVEECGTLSTVFGTLAFYTASRVQGNRP